MSARSRILAVAVLGLSLLADTPARAFSTRGSWSYEARLAATETTEGDRFGTAVALSGSTLVVGADWQADKLGAVYVFERQLGGPAGWGEAAAIHGREGDRFFGWAVALDGDLLAVGNSREVVRVFARSMGDPLAWDEVAQLELEGRPDFDLGAALTMVGDTIIVGAPRAEVESVANVGAVYVFERVGPGEWEQTARLVAPDGAGGDFLGSAVAFDGTTLVAGAPQADLGGALNAGAAYVFTRNGPVDWSVGAKLIASDATRDDRFGDAVGIDGDDLLVGAPDKGGPHFPTDSVYVFTRQGGEAGEWVESARLVAEGRAISVAAGRAAVDGIWTVSIYERGASGWREAARLYDEDGYGGGGYGYALALDGDTLAVSANSDDHLGTYAGIAYVYRDFDLTLAAGGSCPGRLRLELSGAAPRSAVAVASSPWTGRAPGGALCPDALMYLEDPTWLAGGRADGEGRLAIDRPIGVGGCDLLLQAVDLETCRTSSIATLARSSHLELAKLDVGVGAPFGRAVAIEGRRTVVGSSNVAYVHEQDPADPRRWELRTELEPSGPRLDFGSGVALAGPAAAVADIAEEAVFVFEGDQGGDGAWGQVARLEAYGGEGGYPDDFASSVAMSGDLLAVGASLQSGARSYDGAVYLYRRVPSGARLWAPIARLWAEEGTNDSRFGGAVALDGNRLVVGAVNGVGLVSASGVAYVFEATSRGGWDRVAKLVAPDGASGAKFGNAVAVSGDTIVVGAFWADGAERLSGAAYVFQRDAGGEGAWGMVRKLAPHQVFVGESFGLAVGIAGDTVLVASEPPEPTGNTGTVYVFERNYGGLDAWGEVDRVRASDGSGSERFGAALAASGERLLVGASGYGAAYVYRQKPPWVGHR